MPKRTFDTETLLDDWCILDDPIRDRVVDTTRWSVHHEVIFRAQDDGKTYRTSYSRGATEEQDESPWEYEPTVTATEVHEVEVLVKRWVPVPEEDPLDRFERLAAAFYKATGMLAPGKDSPAAIGGDDDYPRRIAAWDKFIREADNA